MSRLRIQCSTPQGPTTGDGRLPRLNGRLAGFEDVRITVVSHDGTETPVHNVESIRVDAVPGWPVKATLTFTDVELDVEAID